MRKSANSTALRERARELGIKPPSYSIPAAQAELQTSEEVRDAAAVLADQLYERERGGADEGPDEPSQQQDTSEPTSDQTLKPANGDNGSRGRSRRGRPDSRVIHLKI
ncbi:MAG TPA: hypothetical protein VL972_10135 [Solirubrobacteraceae bacterium]|nr:hypothetical protein [Solirubrobacteraceae bacterium]